MKEKKANILSLIVLLVIIVINIILYFILPDRDKSDKDQYKSIYQPRGYRRFELDDHIYIKFNIGGECHVIHDPECETHDILEELGYVNEVNPDGESIWVDPD